MHDRSVTMPETARTLANGSGSGSGSGHGDSNDHYNHHEFCKKVADHLNGTRFQAKATYNYIRGYLKKYTENQFNNESPEALHRLWQLHSLNLSHPYAQHVLDFDQVPNESHFSYLADKPISEIVVEEMQKVYKTLKMLELTFTEVINNRAENEIRLLHDLKGNRDRLMEINQFLKLALAHVRIDLQMAREAMEALRIPLPSVNDKLSYNRESEVRDWLLAREHLCVVQFLRALYSVLINKCAAAVASNTH